MEQVDDDHDDADDQRGEGEAEELRLECGDRFEGGVESGNVSVSTVKVYGAFESIAVFVDAEQFAQSEACQSLCTPVDDISMIALHNRSISADISVCSRRIDRAVHYPSQSQDKQSQKEHNQAHSHLNRKIFVLQLINEAELINNIGMENFCCWL